MQFCIGIFNNVKLERQWKAQSEHIGQWATPHDRRLGGIGRVVLIVESVHFRQFKSRELIFT